MFFVPEHDLIHDLAEITCLFRRSNPYKRLLCKKKSWNSVALPISKDPATMQIALGHRPVPQCPEQWRKSGFLGGRSVARDIGCHKR